MAETGKDIVNLYQAFGGDAGDYVEFEPEWVDPVQVKMTMDEVADATVSATTAPALDAEPTAPRSLWAAEPQAAQPKTQPITNDQPATLVEQAEPPGPTSEPTRKTLFGASTVAEPAKVLDSHQQAVATTQPDANAVHAQSGFKQLRTELEQVLHDEPRSSSDNGKASSPQPNKDSNRKDLFGPRS